MTSPVLLRLRRITGMLIAFTLVIALLPMQVGHAYALSIPSTTVLISDQLIVQIDPAMGGSIDQITVRYDLTIIEALALQTDTYLVRIPPTSTPDVLAEQLELDPQIEYAEPNRILATPEGDTRGIGAWGGSDPSPMFTQYAVQALLLNEAHQMTQGAGQTIAILDTGVDADHPQLRAAIAPTSYDALDQTARVQDIGNQRDDDGDGLVDELVGHGTHVAGIVHLVAPKAALMVIRVLDSDGNGEAFAIAQAIEYALANDADVINLSLGSDLRSRVLRDTIRVATQRGVVVVAAAGNASTDTRHYPAASSCALAVTASDDTQQLASFANYGNWVDLAAPGVSIASTLPAGYGWWSGTSMSAPFVAGQAALIESLAPALNPRDIGQIMAATARPIAPHRFGVIDPLASLKAAQTGVLPNPTFSVMSGSCVEIP
ncbi:MAG: hypothetical protein OHK0050_42400 [Roseiflexaceae bacterium]